MASPLAPLSLTIIDDVGEVFDRQSLLHAIVDRKSLGLRATDMRMTQRVANLVERRTPDNPVPLGSRIYSILVV